MDDFGHRVPALDMEIESPIFKRFPKHLQVFVMFSRPNLLGADNEG
jgi:hypothetical protein